MRCVSSSYRPNTITIIQLHLFLIDSAIYKVSSVHSNKHEDRTFTHTCRNVGLSGRYYHTGEYVNEYDRPAYFVCPLDYVLTGKI